MTEDRGPVTLDGTKGLWTLEEVQALLEALGHAVEIETPLDRSSAGPEQPPEVL